MWYSPYKLGESFSCLVGWLIVAFLNNKSSSQDCFSLTLGWSSKLLILVHHYLDQALSQTSTSKSSFAWGPLSFDPRHRLWPYVGASLTPKGQLLRFGKLGWMETHLLEASMLFNMPKECCTICLSRVSCLCVQSSLQTLPDSLVGDFCLSFYLWIYDRSEPVDDLQVLTEVLEGCAIQR